MHLLFIPYGMKDKVEFFLSELEHYKLPMAAHKEGEPDKTGFVQCQLRKLPFGIYEFIFPKEHYDAVANAICGEFLKNQLYSRYDLFGELSIMGLKFKPLEYLKKYLKAEDLPPVKTDALLPVYMLFVSVIPIGVKHDGDITEANGWTHESI